MPEASANFFSSRVQSLKQTVTASKEAARSDANSLKTAAANLHLQASLAATQEQRDTARLKDQLGPNDKIASLARAAEANHANNLNAQLAMLKTIALVEQAHESAHAKGFTGKLDVIKNQASHKHNAAKRATATQSCHAWMKEGRSRPDASQENAHNRSTTNPYNTFGSNRPAKNTETSAPTQTTAPTNS